MKRPADKRRQRRVTAEDYWRLGDALRAAAATAGEADQAIVGARLLASLPDAASAKS